MLAGYRGEPLVLLCIALASLVIVNVPNTADVSRLALTEALVRHGTVATDRTGGATTVDRARHGGRTYSDKAPGVSFLAVVPVELLRAADAAAGRHPALPLWRRASHLWFVRLLTGGVFLLVSTYLLGRAAEAIARGTGAATAVTYGLGTIAGPLGPTTFGHVGAAALGFGAFLLVRARRPAAAGLVAGAAVLVEYQAALIALVLLVLCGRRAWRFLVGAIPAAAALGAYDQAAFGAPWRLSYRYVANRFAEQQQQGFFGIGRPDPHALGQVLAGGKGLLLVSPVLAAAAAGLWLLWRRGLRAEASVCVAVTLLFLLADAGYFDPYGGTSPGPRFFAPALPFLCLGLAEAYRRAPAVTAALALPSLAVATLDALSWAYSNRLAIEVPPQTVWSLAGAPLDAGVALVCAATAAAVAAAALSRARTAAG